MPHYLTQIAYTSECWAALLEKPQNRFEAVLAAIEKLGGKIEDAFLSFGEYDVVAIVEMPDSVSAAALSMAFASGGACKDVKTTPLLTPDEGVEAMNKAAKSGYKPAKG